MQVNENYDLIVVGNQLAGYFLAVAAAKQGKRVLVIESKAKESAIFERPSGHFLADFSWEPIIGLDQGTSTDEFLRDIGLYNDLETIFPRFMPQLQLVSPKARVNFDYTLKKMTAEWEREFPESAVNLQALMNRVVSASSMAANKTFAQLIAELGLDPQWEQLADIQAPLYSSMAPENMTTALAKFYMENAARGVRYPVGGRDAIKEILSSRLKWYGGKVKRDACVEEIIFEKGKLSGALLSSFEGFVRSKMVIGSMPSAAFLNIVPPEFRPETLVREVESLEPRYWRLSFTVKIPESVLPEGMGNHVCYHELGADLEEDQFLQVFVLPKGSYSGLTAGQKVLLVRTLLPIEAKTIRQEYIAVTIKRCLQKMQRFIPFIQQSDTVVIPNPNAIASDYVFKNFLNFTSVDAIPSELLVYGKSTDASNMTGVHSNWSKYGLTGLALCSRDVNPALGIIGEVKTAMELLGYVLAVH